MMAAVGLHLIIDGAAPPVTSWVLADYVRKCARAIDMTIVLGPVLAYWPATEDHRQDRRSPAPTRGCVSLGLSLLRSPRGMSEGGFLKAWPPVSGHPRGARTSVLELHGARGSRDEGGQLSAIQPPGSWI